jgi:tetratricopeptide (TPR) repeat protein
MRAKQVFDYLWQEKPNRYKPRGYYKLSDAVESQLNEEIKVVGNCLRLTILYNCLLKRIGVHAEALQFENAFGVGPHVLSILAVGYANIHIENILEKGFDYKGHRNNASTMRWGDRELLADIYHSQGNDYFQREKFGEALKCYDKAIYLNPPYKKVRLNKAILMDKFSKNFS